MNSVTQKAVLEFFGVDTVDELNESDELASIIMDSVQPSFCTECGAEGPDLEPDASGVVCDSCKQQAVSSIGVIILGF